MDTNIFIVIEAETKIRIDKLLSQRFEDKSRTYFQYLVEEGCVLLNGKPVKKRHFAKQGDEIEVFFRVTPEIQLEPENIPLDILYEDDWIIAVHKPPGMVVHPAPGNWSHTFVNALLYHCKNLASVGEHLRPGIVHRLDKDTSGVLLAAKTPEAHRKLIEDFSVGAKAASSFSKEMKDFPKRRIKKQYLAICHGKPKSGLLQAAIARHPTKRKQMSVQEKGKKAFSNIQVLAFDKKKSLVLIEPVTGRTHQIRVHLQHLHAPILGDCVYGNAGPWPRQLLHAYRLSFFHPITNAPMNIVAPVPHDMKSLLQKEFCPQAKNLAESFS